MSVDPLNGGHLREQTFSDMTDGINQQPLDGVGIIGVGVGHGLARDFAAVFQFPRRAGEMTSYDLAVFIFQLRIGCFEGPGELAVRAAPAGINL